MKAHSKQNPAQKLSRSRRRRSSLVRVLEQEAARLTKLAVRLGKKRASDEEVRAVLDEMRLPVPAKDNYKNLVRRVRNFVQKHLPSKATVLVVSKGDSALLKLIGKTAWHFPRNAAGEYPGYSPACDLSAIAQLEALRAQGAQYLVLPQTAFWWLDHYHGFRQHLEEHCPLVARDEKVCAIYSLNESVRRKPFSAQLSQFIAEFQTRFEREPMILDWNSDVPLSRMVPRLVVFQPPSGGGPLPYFDHTVDVVMTASEDGLVAGEARRIAAAAVAIVAKNKKDERTLIVEWSPDCPESQLQKTSIVIPCHNGRALTDACLKSLLNTLPHGFDGEIIVVDDASNDGTVHSLKQLAKQDARLKVFRNKANLGFVDSCNRGASEATGGIVIFLNNDLVLLPGWFEPMLRVLREFPQAGAVGGKLILPDGTLQEAGGVVFRDGSAMNFGRSDARPAAPLYSFLREVDYCSGALLATRRDLFEKLGGFDENYRPGYYEDTDYCFKVREAGFRVYFQPESAVVHREGGTAGTNVSHGMKRYQVINQAKFIKRWGKALKNQPPRPRRKMDFETLKVLARRDVWEGKVRTALVCALMPEYDRDSGSRRVHDLLNLLQEDGWAVTFVSHHEREADRYSKALQQRGIPVYNGANRWMKELVAAGGFDLAVFGLWHVAEPYVSAIRKLSPATRIIVDSIDLHFLRLARGIFLGATENGSGGLLDANYASEMMRELNTYAASDAVLTVSQKEADLINDLVADPELAHAMPDNEESPVSPVSLEERKGMVFIGCFRHTPNIGAVEFLCKEILPKLDPALLAEHPVYIVGDGLSDEVRALGTGLPYVKMVGWVPSVLPYLERARISVIPLRFGAGTKRKMLQTLRLGTPAVSTSVGAEGFNLQDGKHALIADDAGHFADCITRLLTDSSLWNELAQEGRRHIAALHGREVARKSLQRVIQDALATEPKQKLLGDAKVEIKTGWLPYLEYDRLVDRIRDKASEALPANATVLVVSKGDDELLKVNGCNAWHFPRAEDGAYAGHYPADSAAVISHLESLREAGGEFLLFPNTALWWLEHYPEFRRHLEANYRQIIQEPDTCVIYELRGAKARVIEASEPRREHPSSAPTGKPADVKLIAFYLPQFHPIPENDKWWGKGFTEWTNVSKAQPLFSGHYQPQLPADLGFYDLRLAATRHTQAELARAYGIHGFCYYHYWFDGKRLLERPFNEVLASGEPDFPFCLCWANEPWSRRWNGRAEDVLQPQNYSAKDDLNHIRWLIPALADKRAIRIEGKPVFIVYQGRDLPDPARTVKTWRREVANAGLPGIYLMSVETGWDAGWDATSVGFDAKILFQPQFATLFNSGACIPIVGKDKLRVFDYQKAWPVLANPEPVKYRRYDAVFPRWDNSPRSGDEAVVVHNSTPEAYEAWLRQAIAKAQAQPKEHRIVFLNAWNEWAEGASLEPDSKDGRAYLEATARAVSSVRQTAQQRGEPVKERHKRCIDLLKNQP